MRHERDFQFQGFLIQFNRFSCVERFEIEVCEQLNGSRLLIGEHDFFL